MLHFQERTLSFDTSVHISSTENLNEISEQTNNHQLQPLPCLESTSSEDSFSTMEEDPVSIQFEPMNDFVTDYQVI